MCVGGVVFAPTDKGALECACTACPSTLLIEETAAARDGRPAGRRKGKERREKDCSSNGGTASIQLRGRRGACTAPTKLRMYFL